MKVGGTRRIFIPAQYAYGVAGSPQGGIPPNADLVFDITLLAVK
jgi:FKBP-type peptidyl-prolyl cis-trans isomerase